MELIHALQAEWIKTKRTAASWLCLIGGTFIPFILLVGFIKDHESINDYKLTNIWEKYFFDSWRFMSLALLPAGVILASSLVTQIEYKNNTTKQLHTTPQKPGVIFFSKLIVIMIMTAELFLLFNIASLATAIIPSLLFQHRLPIQPFPFLFYLKWNLWIYVTCLPIIALQFFLALQFKNFIVPVGVGILILVGTLILIKTWQYAWLSPYSYTPLLAIGDKSTLDKINIPLLSLGYFSAALLINYLLYISNKEKS